MANDIFSEGTLDSLVAQAVAEIPDVDIRILNVQNYHIPSDYVVVESKFSSDNYGSEIRGVIKPIIEEAENKGCNPNLHTALYEAVLNAHQHGNKLNPDKKVKICYKITDNIAEIGVVDQGGKFKVAFIPFIFKHKRKDHEANFIDFYRFAGLQKPATNNGTGTSFMHTYVDNVSYFRSEEGGLVVHITKSF
ncbi:ATP-binding protein [Candidatus Woesearchaeota archaeon]|nr:ATP-binding protein [Candidatus Woesearchaeota archaeon]